SYRFTLLFFRSRYTFLFTYTATTQIYPLSLHDALPILDREEGLAAFFPYQRMVQELAGESCQKARIDSSPEKSGNHCDPQRSPTDRKSTRLNSSHVKISYAVFCLKKKKKKQTQ